ncbi:hypothetical protein [Candidatus Magnetominusculus xianensis]|uniref:STAS domain-containing protein n=1 Tax=Candidatus Magnetominusculus xianensis TaxID=1748249 RepID=A0ABR5SEA2_9BACT|nr:hypothetical protein [Candidatus Magnetominusculus xianensis]KWT84111.1 hypothetical protein ASN18_2039 [Candidatus Magnetominusculus xianensis]MBF0402405.1 hypothetical protein [Nitrospirota bacterium]
MEIEKTTDTEAVITGHVKTIEDYTKIKQVINLMLAGDDITITIKIPDSISITSSVIGYLLKLVFENKVDLRLLVREQKLYNLLEVLNLITVFKVQKM